MDSHYYDKGTSISPKAQSLTVEDEKIASLLEAVRSQFDAINGEFSKELTAHYTNYKTSLAGKVFAPIDAKEPLGAQQQSVDTGGGGIEESPVPLTSNTTNKLVELTAEQKAALKNDYMNKKQIACKDFEKKMYGALSKLLNDLVKDLPVFGKLKLGEILARQQTDVFGLAERYSDKDAQSRFLDAYRELYTEHSKKIMELEGEATEAEEGLEDAKYKEKRPKKDPVKAWVKKKVEQSKEPQRTLSDNSSKLLAISKQLKTLL
jgi:hypothetical protein